MTFDMFISSFWGFFLDWATWQPQHGDVLALDRVSMMTTRQLTRVTLSVNTETQRSAPHAPVTLRAVFLEIVSSCNLGFWSAFECNETSTLPEPANVLSVYFHKLVWTLKSTDL